MIGLVEINPINDNPTCATVSVDGNTIHSCSGYTIKHRAGELPVCSISLNVKSNYEHVCDIKIENLKEIADLLDCRTFNELSDLFYSKFATSSNESLNTLESCVVRAKEVSHE